MSPPTNAPDAKEALAEKVRTLPTGPGCYLMKDKKGTIFYIGKARNLRARVRSYFSGSDTRQFVAWLDNLLFDLDVVLVHTEKEALLLERTLVRQHQPRFNVLLKDDKNFIHLRLEHRPAPSGAKKRRLYPRLEVVRNPRDDGARYFGPYHSASSVRAALRVANRHFQLRTCSDSVLENRARPCLQYQIGRCPAPCVQDVPDYADRVAEAALFLSGQGDLLQTRLEERMWQAAQDEHFELAARLRDQLEAVKSSFGKQVVTEVSRRRNQDIIGIVRRGAMLEIARVVVRRGHMQSSDTFGFDKQEFPTAELALSFLGQLYAELDPQDLPDEILVSEELGEEAQALQVFLGERKGKRVEIRKPARGHLRRLIELAVKNADNALDEKLRTADTREKSMERLQKRLRLSRLPRVIECYDISLFQGTDAVASQVCFVDGEADKSRYRRYNIKTVEGTDDFMMMYEALTRRLKRGLEKAKKGESDLPDLLLVDGGKGQLNMALAACRDVGVKVGPDGMHVASIAKARNLDEDQDNAVDTAPGVKESEVKRSAERVFLPNVKDPILLRPHTQERYLVEQIRDEAHRFAITAHRGKRKKRTLRSVLDEIPGVGPQKRKALLKALGSAQAISESSEEELAAISGVGPKLARQIRLAFHPQEADGTPRAPEG